MELAEDELGAGIPDALVRQEILGRVPPDELVGIWSLQGGYPMRRIVRLVQELVEAGELMLEQKDVGDIVVPAVRRSAAWEGVR